MSLEDIEAVVSWNVPGQGVLKADGVLGENFLRHFHVTIERGSLTSCSSRLDPLQAPQSCGVSQAVDRRSRLSLGTTI